MAECSQRRVVRVGMIVSARECKMLWVVLMTGVPHCRRTYGYLFAVKKCLTLRQLAALADCIRGVGLFCLSVNALLTLSVGVTLAKGHGREAIKRTLAIGWDSLHSAMDSPTV